MQNTYGYFEKLLIERYGLERAQKILDIQGISKSKLNALWFRQCLIREGIKNATIDSNGNLPDRTTPSKLDNETFKPQKKLIGLNMLYEKLEELYGWKTADEAITAILDGALYLHDAASGVEKPYCQAIESLHLVMNGRPWNRQRSRPPQHPHSYLGQLVETIMNMSLESTGAIAISDFFIMYAYMWVKEWGVTIDRINQYTKYYWSKAIINQLQSFAYSLNNEVRSSGDSPFTNLSIFDGIKLKQFIKERYMSLFNIKTEEEIEEVVKLVIWIEELYMQMMNNETPPLTFPVSTINITVDNDGNILDQSFLRKASKYNMEAARYNIYFASMDSDKVAMCCFAPTTEVLWKLNNRIRYDKFEDLVKSHLGEEIETLYKGEWVKAIPIKVPYDRDFYRITLRNGITIDVTDDHLHLTQEGLKKTTGLSDTDFLAWSSGVRDWYVAGDYGFGYSLGLYLAEESYSTWIGDKKGFDGCINDWWCLSKEALQGLWHGMMKGSGKYDGTEIYTTSKKLAIQLQQIANVLGILTSIRSCKRTVTIGKKTYTGVVYTVHVCHSQEGKVYVWDKDKQMHFVKIEKIEKIPNNFGYACCFEVQTNEHLFQLPCGLITHNCRLSFKDDRIKERAQDIALRRGIDSFGNGAFSIGSLRVVTINLPRIALEVKNNQVEFKQLLEDRMDLARKILLAQRELVKEGIKQDMFIVFKYNYLRLENMFSTFGIVGLYEALRLLSIRDFDDYIKFASTLFDDIENKIQDYVKEDDVFYNVEQVPAESCAFTLAKLDNILYNYIPNDLGAYSNQFIPLWENVDLFTKIKVDAELVKKLSGGAISHLNIGGKLNTKQMQRLIEYCAKVGLEHFAVNPFISYCPKCGENFYGKHDRCPHCGNDCEVFTRIVGYFIPLKDFGVRKEEVKRRKYFGFEDKTN